MQSIARFTASVEKALNLSARQSIPGVRQWCRCKQDG
jgi:hypothetical protein